MGSTRHPASAGQASDADAGCHGCSRGGRITTDHLGSGDLILDSAGVVLARESFTPFGARRGSNWQGLPSAGDKTVFGDVTRRGFTGHEMLDAVTLIHMNGRVYDPQLGRFLSADPIIQTIALSQALNPFAYVLNNPLTLIDPSGYSFLGKLFHSIGHFFKKFWRPILAITVAIVSFGYLAPLASQWFATSYYLASGTITVSGAAFAGAISGAIAGGIVGGARGALAGLVTGGILGGIGAAYGNTWTLGRVAAEGVAGGIGAELQGGSFVDGFKLAAAFSAVQWGAYKMRSAMVKQSCSGTNNLNCSGESAGAFRDGKKMAGGRLPDGATSWKDVKPSLLGGNQGESGSIFGHPYKPYSFWDHALESYAGPHDWLSSFRYMSNGNLAPWSAFNRVLFDVYSALAILPAMPFAVATAVPSYGFVSSNLEGD